jgi:hypothetical protein
MLITFAELAKLKNVSRAAVSKKKQTGILDAAIVNHNGKYLVNKEMAMDLWDKNTDPSKGVIGVAATTKKELKKKVDALPEDAIPEYNVSRARKEYYQSELAKLQVAQQKKDLIPVVEIKKSSFEIGRSIRESLANLADRLSSQIAGETDSQVIHKLLTDEHREALEELVKI